MQFAGVNFEMKAVPAMTGYFPPSGGQGASLLCKVTVVLLSQPPEAGLRPCAGHSLQVDCPFLTAISETRNCDGQTKGKEGSAFLGHRPVNWTSVFLFIYLNTAVVDG